MIKNRPSGRPPQVEYVSGRVGRTEQEGPAEWRQMVGDSGAVRSSVGEVGPAKICECSLTEAGASPVRRASSRVPCPGRAAIMLSSILWLGPMSSSSARSLSVPVTYARSAGSGTGQVSTIGACPSELSVTPGVPDSDGTTRMPAPAAVASTSAREHRSTSSTDPRHRMPGCSALSIACEPLVVAATPGPGGGGHHRRGPAGAGLDVGRHDMGESSVHAVPRSGPGISRQGEVGSPARQRKPGGRVVIEVPADGIAASAGNGLDSVIDVGGRWEDKARCARLRNQGANEIDLGLVAVRFNGLLVQERLA